MAARRASRGNHAARAIKLFIVGQHPVVLEGLRATLQKDRSITVVGQALSFNEAVPLIKKVRPDVVIFECDDDPQEVIAIVMTIRQKFPLIKSLGFCAHIDATILMAAIEAGINGVVSSRCSHEEIERAIHMVAGGFPYFSPQITAILVEMIKSARRERKSPSRISHREKEVLELVAEGLTSRQIADRLHIGLRTVHSHRERIKEKLGIHSVAGLTKYVLSER